MTRHDACYVEVQLPGLDTSQAVHVIQGIRQVLRQAGVDEVFWTTERQGEGPNGQFVNDPTLQILAVRYL